MVISRSSKNSKNSKPMPELYSSELRIPKERVAIVVGKKGTTKRALEKTTKTKISITHEGEVIISGTDNVQIYITSLVVKAIGRGFNPEIASMLLDEQNTMEIISTSDISKRAKKNIERIRSRLIGRQGKARRMLETLTNTHISVYGKTTTIIGSVYDVLLAKHAVEKLIKGAPHGNVYRYIESQKSTTFISNYQKPHTNVKEKG